MALDGKSSFHACIRLAANLAVQIVHIQQSDSSVLLFVDLVQRILCTLADAFRNLSTTHEVQAKVESFKARRLLQ